MIEIAALALKAQNGGLDQIMRLLDPAVSINMIGTECLGEIDHLVGCVIDGGHSLDALLERWQRRHWPAPAQIDDRFNHRAIDDLQRVKVAGAGRRSINGYSIDDHKLIEQRANPLAPIVVFVGEMQKFGNRRNHRVGC